MLEFGHADIAFGQIVVKGHTRVGEKPQDIVGVFAQTQQKNGRRGLLDTATLFDFGAGAPRIVPFALGKYGFVCPAETGLLLRNPRSLHHTRVDRVIILHLLR